ncbi:helix-turn-helix protein [Herbihabitans rhizosphaerae]|uniref:Helix-turn-helix protein n=1 Tax=Herbihabitans rhizosphaerae TaxID=1872711 RepID=A0A4Q7KGK2_9PSEU|nr:helix-turn-helix transcriptional regulator [Herbihabitans rhizosphaerae]RZS32696.1 helix-turn-helix protein [Herbihabitans rhizosphaerae]
MAKPPSGVNSRGIGLELRRLRREHSVSLQAMGKQLGVHHTTVSRIENGHREPTSEEVAGILAVLGVTGVRRQRLINLARNKGVPELLESNTLTEQSYNYRNFEDRAVKITDFELNLIPGLAQTAEYAHAVISAIQVDEHEEDRSIDERVGLRMARQAILARKRPPRLHILITEAALRAPMPGPRAMARQVRHLADLSESESIEVNVVPATVVAHPGLMGQFVLLDFDKDPTIAFIEDRTTGLFLDDPDKVALYKLTVEKLTDVALDEPGSRELMRSITRDLERE